MISGLLTADESGIEVELDSTFQDFQALLKVSARYPVLHGVTLTGQRFTLFGLVQTGARASLHGPAREVLFVRDAVVGAHLQATATFERMLIRFDHLAEWAVRSGLTRGGQQGQWTLTYARPDPINAATPQGQVGLTFTATFENEPGRSEMDEQVWLSCQPPNPTNLAEIADHLLFPARELISFATGMPLVIEEITVVVPETDRGNEDPAELKFFHRYLQPDPAVRVSSRTNPDEMVFTLADWPGDFTGLVTTWLALKQRASAALSTMFGLAYAPPRWGDTTAMIWAQIIETYHRACFATGPAMQEAIDRHARVLAAAPAGDRQWLEWKLEHADEPSLRRRIQDISRRAKPMVWPVLLKVPGFALRLSNARNAYAHFGIGTSEDASAFDLYGLSQAARWVFTANVLLDLGFTEGAAKALIQKNKEYYHMAFEDWPGQAF